MSESRKRTLPPLPLQHPDAALLALEIRLKALDGAIKEHNEGDPEVKAFCEIDHKIAATDAHTLEGVGVKPRCAMWWMPDHGDECIERHVKRALEAVTRINETLIKPEAAL